MIESSQTRQIDTAGDSGVSDSRSNRLLRPGWLIALPAIVSFVSWMIPWPQSVRTGYVIKEPLSLEGFLYLLAWYSTLALAGTAGWVAGRGTVPIPRLNQADDPSVYRIISLVGAVGVVGMYALVHFSSPGLIPLAVRTNQFNLVRNAVPFAPGVATLRYATIISGGIALYRLLLLREKALLHLANVALLILNIVVASRLALIMSLLIVVGLYFRGRGRGEVGRVSSRTILISVAVTIAVLVTANYLRNANYYEAQYRTTNPIAMMVGETVAYTGAPTQVAIGTTNAAVDELPESSAKNVVEGIVALATPTFIGSPTEFYEERNNWYRGVVSVDGGLTTNSSLALIVGLLGIVAFPFMALACFLLGILMGHFSRYRNYQYLGALVVGYSFAEIWRVYTFNSGIFIFVLLVLTGACLVAPRKALRQVPA